MPSGLGGEKGLEDFFFDGGGDARTVVFYGDLNFVSKGFCGEGDGGTSTPLSVTLQCTSIKSIVENIEQDFSYFRPNEFQLWKSRVEIGVEFDFDFLVFGYETLI